MHLHLQHLSEHQLKSICKTPLPQCHLEKQACNRKGVSSLRSNQETLQIQSAGCDRNETLECSFDEIEPKENTDRPTVGAFQGPSAEFNNACGKICGQSLTYLSTYLYAHILHRDTKTV